MWVKKKITIERKFIYLYCGKISFIYIFVENPKAYKQFNKINLDVYPCFYVLYHRRPGDAAADGRRLLVVGRDATRLLGLMLSRRENHKMADWFCAHTAKHECSYRINTSQRPTKPRIYHTLHGYDIIIPFLHMTTL